MFSTESALIKKILLKAGPIDVVYMYEWAGLAGDTASSILKGTENLGQP